ncbi:hypothetical protein PM082_014232 [Marasmius tenuissimus]|nr:hypothetical protein PM082_014232 [Marasmius tenuissimus]
MRLEFRRRQRERKQSFQQLRGERLRANETKKFFRTTRLDFRRLLRARKQRFQLLRAEEVRANKTKKAYYTIFGGDVAQAEERLARDLRWYSHYYSTLKGSLVREIQGNPFQYCEDLYHNFMCWKQAKRPSISPLAHPDAVFNSLMTSADTIAGKIININGYSPLAERFRLLAELAHELRSCVSSLRSALEEEDSIDEDTFGTLWTVEERYRMGRLRFFEPYLRELCAEVGL